MWHLYIGYKKIYFRCDIFFNYSLNKHTNMPRGHEQKLSYKTILVSTWKERSATVIKIFHHRSTENNPNKIMLTVWFGLSNIALRG